jgi:very-long-chain enoyl-CoA reductase
MASTSSTKLRLTNRSPKQPIKNLPTTVDLPAEATIEDLKQLIAQASGLGDHNRIGIFNPTTKKTFKDRKAKVNSEQDIVATGEVLVKDLGYQIAWRTVFVVEYLGPIIIHPLFIAARPYIYKGGDGLLSTTQWLAFGMIVGHFIKREYETLFVHKFSANTMPWFNIFKNSAHYWLISGVFCAYFLYSPSSLSATANNLAFDAVGFALYVFSEIMNAVIHLHLASLRSSGGTERKIPTGPGFSLVTCPNYMYEMLAWLGILVVSRNFAVAVFLAVGGAQMCAWAKGKERAYRKEFGDKYKKKRYVALPGIY